MRHTNRFVKPYFFRCVTALSLALISIAIFNACTGKRAEEHRYDLKGKVVEVDRTNGKVTIDHGDIVGYMPAMQMPFPLHDADALKDIDSGDQIQATLVVTDDGYWIENPVVTKAQPGAAVVSQPGGLAEPQVGAEIPDVKLVNQDGKHFSTGQLKGRALIVTFIYTRCPMPDQCPLMSANFAQLNAELEKDADLRKKAHLLSITLDPEYDMPEVLRSYGASYAGGKFDNWDFATGEQEQVRRFAEFLGLMYKAENNQVVHSLRTALVAPDGKLYKIYRGNEWKTADLLQDLRALLAGLGEGK